MKTPYPRLILGMLAAVAVLTVLSARAEFSRDAGQAEAPEAVRWVEEVAAPAIVVRNLRAYAGMNLSVYLVSGSEGAISTAGQALSARAVLREPVTVVIAPNGEARIPAMTTPRASGIFSLSHALFVVHRGPKHALRNANGKVPRGVSDAEVSEDELSFERKFHILFSELVERKGVVDPR